MIRVELGAEVSPGIFAFRVERYGVEGRSRQPLLDACRLVKSMGADTADEIGLFRERRTIADLKTTVGYGAKFTVREPSSGGIGFAKYQPFNVKLGELA